MDKFVWIKHILGILVKNISIKPNLETASASAQVQAPSPNIDVFKFWFQPVAQNLPADEYWLIVSCINDKYRIEKFSQQLYNWCCVPLSDCEYCLVGIQDAIVLMFNEFTSRTHFHAVETNN